MFQVKSGQKYIVPSERDVLISFAPVSNDDGTFENSPRGQIEISAILYREPKNITQKADPGIINVKRPGENDNDFVDTGNKTQMIENNKIIDN